MGVDLLRRARLGSPCRRCDNPEGARADHLAGRLGGDMMVGMLKEVPQVAKKKTEIDAKRLTIDEKGRVVLPAEMREAMGVKAGDEIRAAVNDGCIVLMTPEHSSQLVIGMYKHLVKRPGRASDRLNDERRREAQLD